MRLPVASHRTVVTKVRGILRFHSGELTKVIVLQLLVALVAVVSPFLIGRAIDAVKAGIGATYVRNVVIALFVVVVAQGILAFFGERSAMVLGERIFRELRNRVVYAVTHLPLSVVESAGTGDLLGRTTHDVDRVSGFVQRGISRVIIIVLTILVTIVAAFLVDPRVGVVVVLPLIPMYFVVRWYISRTVPAYLAVSALWAGTSGVVSETIEQYQTVDSMSLGPNRISRMDTLIREVWRNERYTAWMRTLFIALMVLILYSPVLIAVLWGAFLMSHGLATLGAVTSVALYAQQLRSPLNELGWWIDEIQFAIASFSRIFGVEELLDGDEAELPSATAEKVRSAAESGADACFLHIEDLHFAYRAGEEVLRGVNLEVKQGETLAIVGPSGAGKSTLGRLIAGINAPTSGRVRVGGTDVTSVPEKERHGVVSLVTQEHHVFVGTIADNLRFARKNASDGQLREALDVVEATPWVEAFEHGMDTLVGSGGVTLTPAQTQQVALARIVLLDPQILVLDEATSLLDPHAARSLERALAHVLEGRTVISIAHRLYTAYDADRVAVMIDGKLAELGTHDELVASHGEYAKLWETWQQD
ncbi:MAG: ABC transporter ATP-binding protein/permease [Ancrocorticia sp.]|jgi:ABC-type multidrug transport system fused ATPase/permease subunit|nr:ABC transporter ATP-binding protein/permease [Ancrocorticia sp.]MCI1896242.1 ABC transporter ATP-binding protein/permease [Ancrocorticia sp.]MCI1933140.1 ABC transporter ATP-binding protein/permease [Ancrocorticia sp.]MCI1963665.1 ABC transporter ATP-binding protein/permease [Ancrocorticia sp.]MCI2002746.1 ABC transporter ATP-binding protein/permease [Ancrocorticia sp.]